MRIIKPSFEIWKQEEGLEGVYKQIERSGRVCYKSEDKITETSAKEMVDRLIKSGHNAMLEHGTVYLEINNSLYDSDFKYEAYLWNSFIDKYKNNKYSKVTNNEYSVYITTNYRVLVENNWLDDLKYICEPTEFHEKRYTVKFICDRGVSHEFVRHKILCVA